MNNALHSLLRTEAWKELEKVFIQEIETLDKCSNIDQNASNVVVARETRARAIAAKSLRNIINKIKIGGAQTKSVVPKRLV